MGTAHIHTYFHKHTSFSPQTKSVFQIGFFTNKVFLYAIGGSLFGQFLVIYFPPLQAVFQTEALRAWDLIILAGISCTVLIMDEIRKWWRSSCHRYLTRNKKKTDEVHSV